MDWNERIKPGIRGGKAAAAEKSSTASAMGSGSLDVYATPAMVALIEGASVAALEGLLPDGYTTVGTVLEIRHLSATPLGMRVTAAAELTEIDGRRLVFAVEASDEAGKIGEGRHERFIVETEKFMKKTGEKQRKD
ncbi:thioesterase family protein [Breznakiella homolactica]|uniref:Thioesterase family protein n=1 Tax=Breznakiella homolactica TaxID=2798577 RepID=A0A7T8BA86_9SPIR|nr:thioesterase family protein [Breznakiella homolactica]QQO09257.1 thioesterase family protein [Breznakiella homolactica]